MNNGSAHGELLVVLRAPSSVAYIHTCGVECLSHSIHPIDVIIKLLMARRWDLDGRVTPRRAASSPSLKSQRKTAELQSE